MPPGSPATCSLKRNLLFAASAFLALSGLPTFAGDGAATLSGRPLPKWFKFYPADQKVTIERTFVKMRDGVKLAVTYYKPADASSEKKVPIVINMVPYRKDDLFYAGDYGM